LTYAVRTSLFLELLTSVGFHISIDMRKL